MGRFQNISEVEAALVEWASSAVFEFSGREGREAVG